MRTIGGGRPWSVNSAGGFIRYGIVGAVQMTEAALASIDSNSGGIRPRALFTLEPVEGQKRHADYADIRSYGERWNIPVWTNPADGDLRCAIRDLQLEALCVFGWSRLIPEDILESLPCYGWHPTLLPKGRGRHPLIWQILKDETQGGFSFFRMTRQADQGPIIIQQPFYNECWTVTQLYERASRVMQGLLPLFMERMAAGDPGAIQEESEASSYAKRLPGDEILNLGDSFEQNSAKVRALTHPYVGASLADGTKIWTVEQLEELYAARYRDCAARG